MLPSDPKDWPQLPSEKWARWNWKDSGFGRWHAIASWGMGKAENGETAPACSTACGRLRTLPSALAHEPGQPLCGECVDLDALRVKFSGRSREDAPSEPVKVPVRVKSGPEPGSAQWQDEGLPG